MTYSQPPNNELPDDPRREGLRILARIIAREIIKSRKLNREKLKNQILAEKPAN